ncbi:MAG TPA: hypothetical protein VER79_06185 [Candidatus Limnocylindrales bacterium]|nr:hypothetical protein [Candidatus Limnocylindrales bacterium]
MFDTLPLTFTLRYRFPLRHSGDVGLLGATAESLWVEEMYGDGWLAQHRVEMDSTISASVDEDEGRAADLRPLLVAPEAVAPRRGWDAMGLNFAGARHRGLRAEDRLLDVIQSISVADKVALAAQMDVPMSALLGVAESYVLAECPLTGPTDMMVCRRLRIACAVPRQLGVDGLPFDYEARELLLLHRFDLQAEVPPLETLLNELPGIALQRPMDCLRLGDRLIVADGGAAERPSAVCVITIDGLPAPDSRTNTLFKKLYG